MITLVVSLSACVDTVEFTVYFDSSGGTEVSPVTTDGSSTVSIPDNPTKEGFTFAGWYWDNVTFETPFTANSLMDAPLSSDMTVYAKWEPIAFNITYVLNGGINDTNNPSTFTSTIEIILIDPTKEGHTFGGWYSDATFTTAYNFTSMSAEDITVYAKWNINSYTLQYLDNDGTVLQTGNYEYGSSLNDVIPPIAVKEGYTFVEWNQDLPETMPAMDLLISARYVTNQYTISFDSNDGSAVLDITQDYATVVTAPDNPTKEGYTFGGWYLEAELTTLYSFTTIPAEDITLYAKWEAYEYTINYYIVGVDQISNIPLSEGEIMIDISLGVENSSVITSEGRIFTWGANSFGQLGIGTVSTYRAALTEITSSFGLIEGEKVVKILLGSQASIAITSTGRVFTWGYNGNGQLGDEAVSERFVPGEITSQFNLAEGEKIVDVSLGNVHASAITSTGRIFTWGWNQSGQLGIGEIDNIKIRTPIDITYQFNLDEGDMITSVSLGSGHSSAMTSQGRIFTWGADIYGQLGNGASDNEVHATPIEITSQFGLSEEESIASIQMSYYHSSAITTEGRVFNWGYNGYGNLGDGTEQNQSYPVEITSNFSLSAEEVLIGISMSGYSHASAITSEGRVFTWGSNAYGQLGIGTSDYDGHSTPIDITSGFILLAGEKVIRMSLGTNHSSAITSTGRIFTWGRDNAGQLGDASLVNKPTPVLITTVSSIKVYSETYGYEAQITEYIPNKEGFTFSGWYSDPELTIPYTFTTMPANTLKLYGMWMIE